MILYHPHPCNSKFQTVKFTTMALPTLAEYLRHSSPEQRNKCSCLRPQTATTKTCTLHKYLIKIAIIKPQAVCSQTISSYRLTILCQCLCLTDSVFRLMSLTMRTTRLRGAPFQHTALSYCLSSSSSSRINSNSSTYERHQHPTSFIHPTKTTFRHNLLMLMPVHCMSSSKLLCINSPRHHKLKKILKIKQPQTV